MKKKGGRGRASKGGRAKDERRVQGGGRRREKFVLAANNPRVKKNQQAKQIPGEDFGRGGRDGRDNGRLEEMMRHSDH